MEVGQTSRGGENISPEEGYFDVQRENTDCSLVILISFNSADLTVTTCPVCRYLLCCPFTTYLPYLYLPTHTKQAIAARTRLNINCLS